MKDEIQCLKESVEAMEDIIIQDTKEKKKVTTEEFHDIVFLKIKNSLSSNEPYPKRKIRSRAFFLIQELNKVVVEMLGEGPIPHPMSTKNRSTDIKASDSYREFKQKI